MRHDMLYKSKNIKITVEEIYDNKIKTTQNDNQFYTSFTFLEFDKIMVGDVIELSWNTKNKCYDEFSLLFDKNYLRRNFKENYIHKLKIIKEYRDFFLLSTEDRKYARIFKNMLVGEAHNYRVNNIIQVARFNDRDLSMFDVNLVNFIKEIKQKSGIYPFTIKKVEKFKSLNSNFRALNFFTTTGFYIFADQANNKLFDLNFLFFKNELIVNNELKLYFSYRGFNNKFRFDVVDSLGNLDEDELYQKLEFDEKSGAFYIKTKYGYAELDNRRYSYLDKVLLSLLEGKSLEFKLDNKQDSNHFSLGLKEINHQQCLEEYEKCKVINYCDNSLDKRIYLIEYTEGFYGFLEQSDYSYGSDFPLIGSTIEKLKIKSDLSRTFLFFTRKPYLIDPKIEFFKNRIIGDKIFGKVKRIDESFITININDSFEIYVFKEQLLPFKFFNITEFYQKDEIYPFYLFSKTSDIKLLGYDYNDFYDTRLKELKNNTLVLGAIYKKMATKYIIRLENNIEAELPLDEISYLGDDNLEVNKDKKYQFKIININTDKSSMRYNISLSRRRMSHPVYHFKRKYPIGSIISGDFFYQDEEGYYFNLKHKGMGIPELTGFLSKYNVANYPDLTAYSNYIINNDKLELQILNYPNENLIKSGTLLEKAVTLSIKSFQDFDIKVFYDSLKSSDLFFRNDNILTETKSFLTDNDRIYFTQNFGKNAIFSLHRNHFIPGISFGSQEKFSHFYQRYTAKLIDYYQNKAIEQKELQLLKIILNSDKSKTKFILTNLDKSYLNEINNSIEIEYHNTVLNKIKQDLNITDLTIIAKDKAENHYWGWFLNNDIFQIKVVLLGDDIELNQTYKITIDDYDENSNSLRAQISHLTEASINKYFKVSVVGKINNKNYSVKFLNDHSGILSSESELYINELLLVQLTSVNSGQYYFKYESKSELTLEELERTTISDFMKILFIPEKMMTLKQEELLSYLISLKSKLATTQEVSKIQRINSLINLVENGTIKDQFIIENQAYGQGQFGKVYKGVNLADNSQVVCKRYTSNRLDDIELKRFKIEAETLSQLDLKGVVKLLKYYNNDNAYISGFASGLTLREYLRNNSKHGYKWKKDHYLDLLIQIANILDEIHQNEIIHCDIKPENIIYNLKSEEVFMIDFGSIQSPEMPGGFGTIFYSSPKQCYIFSNEHYHFQEEHNFTVKDDIYSFGVMMYEMFCGQLPYSSELEEETIIFAHQYGQITEDSEYSFIKPSLINPEIEEDIEVIILRLMALNEEDRYSDFVDIGIDLEGIN